MGRVYVPDFKPGPFTGKPARPQRAQASFVGGFRERVGLIHKLGQLAGSEKLFDNRRYRFGIHQVVRHEGIDFLQAHALFDGPFHAYQTDPVLVLQQFSHGPDSPVAKMVDIIHHTLGIAQRDQDFGREHNVFFAQSLQVNFRIDPQAGIDLQASNP